MRPATGRCQSFRHPMILWDSDEVDKDKRTSSITHVKSCVLLPVGVLETPHDLVGLR